jgi:hypothetical protein
MVEADDRALVEKLAGELVETIKQHLGEKG